MGAASLTRAGCRCPRSRARSRRWRSRCRSTSCSMLSILCRIWFLTAGAIGGGGGGRDCCCCCGSGGRPLRRLAVLAAAAEASAAAVCRAFGRGCCTMLRSCSNCRSIGAPSSLREAMSFFLSLFLTSFLLHSHHKTEQTTSD
jgi:hypothetical protein